MYDFVHTVLFVHAFLCARELLLVCLFMFVHPFLCMSYCCELTFFVCIVMHACDWSIRGVALCACFLQYSKNYNLDNTQCNALKF